MSAGRIDRLESYNWEEKSLCPSWKEIHPEFKVIGWFVCFQEVVAIEIYWLLTGLFGR